MVAPDTRYGVSIMVVDETLLYGVGGALAALVLAGIVALVRGRGENPHLAALADSLARLSADQGQLAGRLSQVAEQTAASQAHVAERLQAQEREIGKGIEHKLFEFSRRVDATLTQNANQAQATIGDLRTRLALIDRAQKTITELSTEVVSLQDILSNKQARGALGQIQLEDIVRSILPPTAFDFQVTLSNGRRADCLVRLPDPPGPIVVDAKFPLESYRALVAARDEAAPGPGPAGRSAPTSSSTSRDIAERYVVPGETAESALMFLPSEAVYAELHAGFPDLVAKSHQARIWIVSPTTLMATLNTVRAVLKDVHVREQAGVLRAELHALMGDVERLDDRVGKLPAPPPSRPVKTSARSASPRRRSSSAATASSRFSSAMPRRPTRAPRRQGWSRHSRIERQNGRPPLQPGRPLARVRPRKLSQTVR